MSVTRHRSAFRNQLMGRGQRMLRSMLSAVSLVAYEARECVRFRGREAANGSADEDTAEQYGVIGVISRPPEGRGRAVLAHIGGDSSHRVIIASKDDETRAAIVEAIGIDWDEVIVHNSKSIIKVTKDGEVLIGNVNDPAAFEPLVKRSEFVGHTHGPGTFVGQIAIQGVSGGAADISGTKYVKAQ